MARNVLHVLCNCTVDQTALALFCVSNWSHAAVACTGGIRAGGFLRPISDQWERVVGGATILRSQWEREPRAGRHRLRVPPPRELEQLLYAGRQRAEAFLSPEKTAQSRFLWITRELEKPCCTVTHRHNYD